MDQIQTVVWQFFRASQELVPWEGTPWHWSKHVKFRPSWLFHKGCLSLDSCQTAILPRVGTLNSANWALGWPWANLGCCLHKHRKTLMSTKACFSEAPNSPKTRMINGVLLLVFPCPNAIQTCQIQDIMTVPQRLSFSARLTNCNVGPCWHVLAHVGIQLSPHSIHWDNSFSGSIKFFHLKIALGWPWANLGCRLRNHRKTLVSSVYLCLFSWEGVPRQTCIK